MEEKIINSDVKSIDDFAAVFKKFKAEIAKVIVGQDIVVEQVLISIFSKGHCLLVGVPGLAKTLLVQTIADCLGLKFNRIQFTPDLMPSDIVGAEILDESRQFKFVKGPLFANIILADEINRTPPKTQSALLEAMQERSVTNAGNKYELDNPFFVLATQNPIEQEGTYPLPEAQLDRFLMQVDISYPGLDDEWKMLIETTGSTEKRAERILTADELRAAQLVAQITERPVSASHQLSAKLNGPRRAMTAVLIMDALMGQRCACRWMVET